MTNVAHDNSKIPGCMRDLSLDENGMPIPFIMSHRNDQNLDWKISLLANRLCAISGKKLDETVTFVCTPDQALVNLYCSIPMRPECADFVMRLMPEVVELLAPNGPGFFVTCTTSEYAYTPSKGGFEATGYVDKKFWDEGKIIPDEIISSLKNLIGI